MKSSFLDTVDQPYHIVPGPHDDEGEDERASDDPEAF